MKRTKQTERKFNSDMPEDWNDNLITRKEIPPTEDISDKKTTEANHIENLNIKIVPAKEASQLNTIEQLAYKIIPEFYDDVIPHDHNVFFVKKFQTTEAIQEQLKNGYEYYLLINNDKTIGYFGLEIDKEKSEMLLSKLYLLKEYRGFGYGTRAMDFITERINQLNIAKTRLTVNRNKERTIRFYKRYGFEITKELVNKFENGHKILDYEMTRKNKAATSMTLIDCQSEHLSEIKEIMNDAILHTTATYYSEPKTMEEMQDWFVLKRKNNFPVFGIVDEQDTFLGFGSYGTFRNWPGYRYTVEHSFYVHKNHRGKGVGKILLSEIIKRAKQQNYHCLIAGVDATNTVSIQLHLSFGFVHCGKIREVGHKFSKWLDLEIYQLILDNQHNE